MELDWIIKMLDFENDTNKSNRLDFSWFSLSCLWNGILMGSYLAFHLLSKNGILCPYKVNNKNIRKRQETCS